MAIDIVNALVGGGVGVGMDVLVKLGVEIIGRALKFNPTLESNKKTLNLLSPLVAEIMRCNENLPSDQRIHGLQELSERVREGNDLAEKYSKPGWWMKIFHSPCRQKKLEAKDEELQRQLAVEGQTQILTVVMKILEKVGSENFGMRRLQGGAPKEPPEFKGMKDPLRKLRTELLDDDVAAATPIVLTGLGGSGKSTLAKKICWDPQVKDKFGENIFFVTVTQTPDVKSIVQKLFEYCGYPVSKFETNPDDTINRLGVLLRHVHGDGEKGNPILLILDDVWDNSEDLVKKFNFQIPRYKLLVTSRVAFKIFGTPIPLEPVGHDVAVSIFRHFAQLDDSSSSSSYKPEKELVDEIVKRCMGSPLALEVVGGSLCKRHFEDWKTMNEGLESKCILESSTGSKLLSCLQQSLDVLEVKFDVSEKECFMDLGLFPEDQRIPVLALIDMWAELHNLNDDSGKAMVIIRDLITKNLIKLIVTRKVAKDEDMYYNNHFVTVHDLLRELAIIQSKQEEFDQTKKLIIELNGDKRPKWWVGQNQQGIIGHIWSHLTWWTEKKELRVAALVLSISTDESFSSDWCDILPDEAKVLVLNIRSSQYSLPQFTKKMSKLKFLIITNYGFHSSELNKFELLSSLANLEKIRLENVSVPLLCILKNLRKLSLHMCNTKQAFENSSIKISDAMPLLVEMSIDYCKDLEELPNGVCEITKLKKLSITNCPKLSALPQDISKLQNLEVMRLSSCSDLKLVPDRVEELQKLRILDISGCVSLSKLPKDIGELQQLEKLYMKGCSGLSELPESVEKFGKLKHDIRVICDEVGAALWENVASFPNLKIETPKMDISLNWLGGVYSLDHFS